MAKVQFSDDKQRSGGMVGGIRFECGCISLDANTDPTAASASWVIPTRLNSIIGGMALGCVSKSVTGHPVRDQIGSFCGAGCVCAVGAVDFTLSDSTDGPIVYELWGW